MTTIPISTIDQASAALDELAADRAARDVFAGAANIVAIAQDARGNQLLTFPVVFADVEAVFAARVAAQEAILTSLGVDLPS